MNLLGSLSVNNRIDNYEEERKLVFPKQKRQIIIDETLLDKIFLEATELRNSYRKKQNKLNNINVPITTIKPTRTHFLSCTNPDCSTQSHMVGNKDGDYVCTQCGLVKYSNMFDKQLEFVGMDIRLHNRYDHMSHYGEKISQCTGATPPIPLDLLVPIDEEYQKGDYPRHKETLSRDCVARVLANTSIPKWLQIKYQSERYKKSLCKDLHRQKYFSERWISLRHHWLGVTSTIMLPILVERLRFMFALFVTTFKVSRHNNTCTGSLDCHKRGKLSCSHNMPPYYFITGHIFRVIMRAERLSNYRIPIIYKQLAGQPCPDLFQLYMPYMPCLRLGTYQKYNKMISDAFHMLGWSHSFQAIDFTTPYTHEWTFGLRPK